MRQSHHAMRQGISLKATGAVAAPLLLLALAGWRGAPTMAATGPITARPATSAAAASDFPVTIRDCGVTTTYTAPPKRVVTLFPPTTEMMLQLGLSRSIVGIAGAAEGQPSVPDLLAAYKKLPVLSKTAKVSKEVLLSAHPDFVFDNLPTYFYSATQGFATQQQLRAAGANIYTLTPRCKGDNPMATIEDIYGDLLNLGKIFGVPARARAVVASMRVMVADVHRRVAGRTPLRVLLYFDGTGPIDVWTSGIFGDELRLAGARSAIDDPAKTYETLSKEQVAASNPDAIIDLDYPGKSVAADRQFLLRTFANTPAAKHKRIYAVLYQRVNPGVENPLAVQDIARALYPEAFK